MSCLVLTNRDMENGRYIEGFLTDYFAPKNKSSVSGELVYKCYIPFTGRVARVPEMYRYFFYHNIKEYDIDKIYLTSDEVKEFIDDEIRISHFDKNGYSFVKMCCNTVEEKCC